MYILKEKKKGKKTNKQKTQPIQTDHFGTINSYMVLMCWHIITKQFALHWIKITFTDKLIHDGF